LAVPKGIAGFTALVNSAKLSAANAESSWGRKPSRSLGKTLSKGSKNNSVSIPISIALLFSYNVSQDDDVLSVGTIIFAVVGIEPVYPLAP
jgi:hypothetical protein